ncbi:sensor histidine kinase [Streptomyces sp. NPDC057702]|uniref:sensor histidine kinase n=1 Tax=unclassified Streptomyces TaxID=2593676 RepID=UPI0036C64081
MPRLSGRRLAAYAEERFLALARSPRRDPLLAAAAAAFVIPSTLLGPDLGLVRELWLTLLIALAGTAAIVVRRAHPVAFTGAASVAFLASGQHLPLYVATYTAVRHRRPWLALATIAVPVAAWSTSRALDGADLFEQRPVLSELGELVFPALLGLAVRAQRAAERSRRARWESERRASELDERTRISALVHDGVGHRISLMSIQAASIEVQHGTDERTRRKCWAISDAAAEAMEELRVALEMLRRPAAVARTNEPLLDELEPLLRTYRAHGMPLEVTVSAAAHDAPEPAQRLCSRVLREGLNNAARHARGAATRLRVTREGATLRATVDNDPPPEPRHALPGTGQGLTALTQALARAGGTLRAEPTPEGGFRLSAELPLTEAPD